MNKLKKKSFWQTNYWIAIVVVVIISGWVMRQPMVWDFWMGLGYEPSAQAEEIRDDLELTDKGKRIFAATRPEIEASGDFNEHCDSHDADVSLLGCYTEWKIYVYEITTEQLVAANKVTMAHELLHAVWERMGKWERTEVEGMLEEVYVQEQEWFDEELEPYAEEERLEEIYTRAATKLMNLPEELEEHYTKIFRNRKKIVEFYQEYEAPFVKLREEIEELEEKIEEVKLEIEQGKAEYLAEMEGLDARIDQFNTCADTAGCFSSQAEFTRRRNALVTEREGLEKMREELNTKITENNQRIIEYREKQTALGVLGDAMNSNIEKEL